MEKGPSLWDDLVGAGGVGTCVLGLYPTRGGGRGAMAAEDTTALLRASEVYPVFELFCRYWGLHSIPECYIWSTCGVREKELNEGMRGGKGVSGGEKGSSEPQNAHTLFTHVTTGSCCFSNNYINKK